ncbi:hypothetical protein [Streptomyces sp. NBC_00154]|uniref:hypothetical protein n=1 Tax=Streptomyces sp. NBC_00154 TaxID=2975670 RepID=UPI002254E23D|nr:hypothetical protein [Streptomyces sp. NBC_00154]MCX5311206.1 hypothetical protein [Streptomyces sp. NBC_00154]
MSNGDPNNPYGQQPGGQPGYGYPQQAPQGVPQQGYGYPQAPPVQPGYGFPGAPVEMPGGVKAARVMLWVVAAFQIIGAIIAFAGMGAVDDAVNNAGSTADTETIANFGKGLLAFIAVLALIFAGLSVALALKMKTGGNTIRVCAIVYGAFICLGGIFQLPLGIVTIALGVLIIVFVAKSDGAAWFQRPRA